MISKADTGDSDSAYPKTSKAMKIRQNFQNSTGGIPVSDIGIKNPTSDADSAYPKTSIYRK
jgi:hypothetical protein